MYGKLVNENLEYAPNRLIIGDIQVWNAPSEEYLAQGWFPVVFTEEPTAPTGYHYESGWEQDGNEIIETWTLVDNVVMVIHYENLESIFHHFYGDNTCFEGYIHKFADKGRFVYSLKAESLRYYYKCLVQLTNLPENFVKDVLPDDRIRSRTLRELGNSLDNAEIQRKEVGDCPNDITAFMVCMRRLGLDDNEIIGCFRRAAEQNMAAWMRYMYPYLNHFGMIEENSIQLVDHEGRKHGYYFHNKPAGLEVGSTSFASEGHFWKIGEIVQQVLTLVSK